MATDRLRVEGNERLDLADFQFALGDQTLANHRQLLSQLICSPTRERKWVLSGFAITSPTGTQVQVTKGRGLFAETRSGAVYYGILTTEGDATKIVDINTYPTGLYGVYVRFDEVEGSFQPRIFWNAAGLGSEYTETVATRYLANWSLRIEAASPGDEWLQIGTVNRGDMALVDMRDFYFEGPVDGSYASGWSTDGGGGANDRSADRKTYGVTDFQQFSAATRQCLEDIKGRGLRRWWERDIGGMNLGFDAAPIEDRLALGDANFFLDGGATKRWQFAPDDHLTYDRTGNALTLAIGAAIHNWDATSQSPETTDVVDLGKAGKRYSKLHLGGDARLSRAAAGAGERNWQLSIADVGGFETLQLGSQSEAWDSFAAALSITRAADAGTITKLTLPNGLYYDVANYALCANTSSGSLGKTGERWKYAYIDTLVTNSMQAPNITAETAFLPDANDGANLGASDKYFLNGWVTNLTFTNGVVNTALKPDINMGADLGDGSTYFGYGFVDILYLGTGAGKGVATHLYPTTNNMQHFGTADYRWAYGNFSLGLTVDCPTEATVFTTWGSGTTDGRNWGVTADTVWRLRLYDATWANPVDALSITRSGTTPIAINFGAAVIAGYDIAPATPGACSVGISGTRFGAGYFTRVYSTYLANQGVDITLEDNIVPYSTRYLGTEALPFSSVVSNHFTACSTAPYFAFCDTDAALVDQRWRITADAAWLHIQTMDGTDTTPANVESFQRVGVAPWLQRMESVYVQPRADLTSRLGDTTRWWAYCFVGSGYLIRTDADMGGTTSGWSCFTAVLNAPTDVNTLVVHGKTTGHANTYWMKFYCNDIVLAIPCWPWADI